MQILWKCHELSTLVKIVFNTTFCLTALLNVKTVAGRCIKSAYYIMTSSGHQGKRLNPLFSWSLAWHDLTAALFVSPSYNSFICDNCMKKSGKTRKENKFSAKSECFWSFFLLASLSVAEWSNPLCFSDQGYSARDWARTSRTEWISTWRGRITPRPERCLCGWSPALIRTWRSNLGWNPGNVTDNEYELSVVLLLK